MRFIINDLKYDTEKMELLAEYSSEVKNKVASAIFGRETNMMVPTKLCKSKKGRFLEVLKLYDKEYRGKAITETEAKEKLKYNNYNEYAKIYGELDEA